MTRAKVTAVLIFMGEAGHALDAARLIAEGANDGQTTAAIIGMLRGLLAEMHRLEQLRGLMPR